MKQAHAIVFCVFITLCGVYLSNPTEQTTRLTDSDADGVSNEYERQHSLDPHTPDTDGDGIDDGTEVYGSKIANESRLDPLHKDLVVVLGESNGSVIDESDDIRRIFENVQVANPDGELGIDIHLEEKRLDSRIEWTDTSSFYFILYNHKQLLLSDEVGAAISILSVTDNHTEHGGYANTGGAFAVVGDGASQRLVVHELLHLVAGNFQIDECDSTSHLCEDTGLLYPTVSSDMSRLSSDTRRHLNETGLDT